MKRIVLLLLMLVPLWLAAQQFTWNTYPANTYADTAHHPFILGVASSEPDTAHVYLWTYAEPDSFTQTLVNIDWELATDSTFNNIIKQGTVVADSSHSYTTTFKVDGLNADTYYWYRFTDGLGHYSVIGRTRTLPANSDDITLAVSSCSNIIAFYNTYARMAERNDLNAILHLGDWAYDNLNQNRSVRFPDPSPTIRCGLNDRRQRDYLHLLDPDLRYARQRHPFIYLWDNHDVQKGEPEAVKDVCRTVFREFTGQSLLDSADLARQYRKISMGPLIDLFIIDVQYTQDRRDSINGYESYLGAAQYNWLLTELQNSTATWKLVGNQKLVSPFSVEGLETFIPNGVSADEKSWDGFFEERTNLLAYIRDNNIDNVMMLSGDAHFTVVADLPIDPFDSLAYDGQTGVGSVAVEFLPSGISSPNIDERGINYSLGPTLQSIAYALNPHQVYDEFMDNGYGILKISADSISAEVWLLSAQNVNTDEYLADVQVLKQGVNHWERSNPSGIQPREVLPLGITAVYPNPARQQLNVDYISKTSGQVQVEVLDAQGKIILSQNHQARMGTNTNTLQLDNLPAGTYLVKISNTHYEQTQRFVKQ